MATQDRRRRGWIPVRSRRAAVVMIALLLGPLPAATRAQDHGIDPPGARVDAVGPALRADQLPRLRPGQWDTRYVIDGRTFTYRECLTPTSWRPGYEGCPGVVIRSTRTGGYVLTGACTLLGRRTEVFQHAEGDFTSRFSVESRTSTVGDGRAETHSNATTGRYVGPCPAAP